MKDVEESLDNAQDDFEGMRMKTGIAVEATTLGINRHLFLLYHHHL